MCLGWLDTVTGQLTKQIGSSFWCEATIPGVFERVFEAMTVTT